MQVILSLTVDELELVQACLRNERTRLVEKIAHSPVAGYSPAVVQLCRERLNIEAVLSRIEERSNTVIHRGGRPLMKGSVRVMPSHPAAALAA